MAKLFIKNKFGQTPVELLKRSDISLKAKGIFAYLQSKPDDWDFSMESMSFQLKEGIKSIRNAIKELESAGYLIRDNKQNSKGIWETDYYLYIEPVEAKPLKRKSQPYSPFAHADNGHAHNADTAKPAYKDKKNLDKKNSKKDIVIKKKKKSFDAEDYLDSLSVDEEIKSNLRDWIEVRKAKKVATTQRAVDITLQDLSEYDKKTQIKMIQNSIINAWPAIYPVRNTQHSQNLVVSTSDDKTYILTSKDAQNGLNDAREVISNKEKQGYAISYTASFIQELLQNGAQVHMICNELGISEYLLNKLQSKIY